MKSSIMFYYDKDIVRICFQKENNENIQKY